MKVGKRGADAQGSGGPPPRPQRAHVCARVTVQRGPARGEREDGPGWHPRASGPLRPSSIRRYPLPRVSRSFGSGGAGAAAPGEQDLPSHIHPIIR
jgi:hypothetical protein